MTEIVGAKVPFSTQISPDLKAAVTATVIGLRNDVDASTTISSFVEAALHRAVREAEDRHHDNQPWPPGQRLPPGRPAPTEHPQNQPDSTKSPT